MGIKNKVKNGNTYFYILSSRAIQKEYEFGLQVLFDFPCSEVLYTVS